MLKRMMLLAVAALATMAFAVPAIAAASGGAIYDVTTEGEPTLGEGEEVTLSGNAGFVGPWGGFTSCAINGALTQGAGASEVAVSLTVVPGCNTGVGAWAGCEVVEGSAEGEGTVTGHDIDAAVVFTGTNDENCGAAAGHAGALEHVTLHLSVTLSPEAGSGTSLDRLTVTGGGTLTTAIGEVPITVTEGSTVGADEEGTWAIETL